MELAKEKRTIFLYCLFCLKEIFSTSVIYLMYSVLTAKTTFSIVKVGECFPGLLEIQSYREKTEKTFIWISKLIVNGISHNWLGKIWLSRAPTWQRDGLQLYNFGYIFFVITLKKKTRARFSRKQIVFEKINFIHKGQFWLMESLRKYIYLLMLTILGKMRIISLEYFF